MAYHNNPEITDFIARAQARVMALGRVLVLESNFDQLPLTLDLYRAIELITSPLCILPEEQILQLVHHLSARADLYPMPVHYIPGFSYNIITGEGTPSLAKHRHHVSDIDGLDVYVDMLVRRKLEELLKNQLDDVEFAWVQAGARPMVQPVVRMSATLPRPATNGYYEKGQALTPIELQPKLEINGGGKITGMRLLAGTTLLASRTDGSLSYFKDTVARYDTVRYRLEVDFEKTSTKTFDLQVNFLMSSLHGVLPAGATYAQLTVAGIRQLLVRAPEMAISFPFVSADRKPFFAHPETDTWKEAKEIKVAGFATKTASNWRIWREEIVLHAELNIRQTMLCYQWLGSHNQPFTYTFFF